MFFQFSSTDIVPVFQHWCFFQFSSTDVFPLFQHCCFSSFPALVLFQFSSTDVFLTFQHWCYFSFLALIFFSFPELILFRSSNLNKDSCCQSHSSCVSTVTGMESSRGDLKVPWFCDPRLMFEKGNHKHNLADDPSSAFPYTSGSQTFSGSAPLAPTLHT